MRQQGDGRQVDGGVVTDALMGAVAAGVAVWVFDKLDWAMYEREDESVRQRTLAARPGGEAPAQVIVSKAARALHVDPGEHKERLGQAVHYGLGIGPGALYGALHSRAPAIATGRGSFFGLSLFLLQDEGLNTVLGLAGKPQEYPWQAHARGLVSHLVYGLVTDALFRGMKAATQRGGISRSFQPRDEPAEMMEGSAETGSRWRERPSQRGAASLQ